MENKKLISWTAVYSVGYEVIDNQHQRLVEIINDLYNAFSRSAANDEIEPILKRMLAYTEYHFQTEEKCFAKYKYVESEKHTQEHDSFIEKTKKFYDDYQNGSATVSYEVMNFLREWLISHIMGSDQEFGEYCRKNGIVKL